LSKKKAKVVDSDSESDSSSSDDEAPALAPAPVVDSTPTPPVTPVPPFAAKATEEALVAEEELDAPIVLEKLDTPPEPPKPTVSNHVVEATPVKAPVTITKMESPPAEAPMPSENPPKLLIDTEPSVHFTPYDTVFDENTPGVSEIRYTEKVSVEDKPTSNWGIFDDEDEDDVPRLSIGGSSEGLDLNDIEDLDGPPRPTGVTAVTPEEDIDAPLTSTGDFEELA
jgi:hypothetical protein